MAGLSCVSSKAVANSFLQLAKRGYCAGTSARSFAPLDFLLPHALSTADCHAASLLRASSPVSSGSSPRHKVAPTSVIQQGQRRSFVATAKRNATTCVLNPLTDDEGKEMMLEITPRAAKRLSEIMKKDNNPNLALRIQVESGGCHGFQYLMSLVTVPAKDTAEWSQSINDDDTIFQFSPDEGDAASIFTNKPRIILDEPSLDLLKGSKVDFTMELIGSQFKIVDNPYATSSCGCGTSFDIKV